METTKRRAGRPKAAPQSGPLVLEDDRPRVKIEIELPDGMANELKEYARWVELSSAITTADALSKTVQFGVREVFRRDRLWQEHRRGGGRQEPASGAEHTTTSDARRQAATSAPPRTSPASSPSPSLPPPSPANSPRATKSVEI